jgi:hypothetical protein
MFFIGLLLIIISCKKMDNEKSVIIQDKFNNTDVDSNLNNNLTEYLQALYNGDVDKAMNYCYPDLFVWMQKKVPHNNNLDSIKKTIRTPIIEAKKFNKENGISFQFQISKIKKKVVHKNHKIYIVLVSGIQKTENRKLQIDDEIVAISHNKGQDWKFMMKDDEMTKEILALRFPDETIKQLLEE